MHRSHGKEPRVHLVKRDALPWWKSWLIRIIAVLCALVVCGIITLLVTGKNPISVYVTMIDGCFGTARRTWNLFQNLAILLCISLAVTPAFKMRFWNTGAEGQVLMGCLATAACMILLGDKLSPIPLFILMIVSSIVTSAIWALIPAVFRARWNTNETLFTLMMNYIAIQIVSYFTYIWSVPKGSGQIGLINGNTHAGWMPSIGGHDYLINIIIVAVLTVVIYVYLQNTKHGYEISVVGESQNTARYIGISVPKVIIRTLLLSGAICGIAGLLIVSGTDHTLTRSIVGGRGFTAIMVSWMAKFNPISMVLSSFIIVFLQKGASEISTIYGLNSSFSDILTGIIIFFIIGCEFFINYQIKINRKGETE